MDTQLFKIKFPKELLFQFLNNVCEKNNEYYILNNESYKKSIFLNILSPFFENLKNYYYSSKKFYIERTMNYNNYITIIRQICKSNNISLIKLIKYYKSGYNIEYHIYY
jgi:hypothetical protein